MPVLKYKDTDGSTKKLPLAITMDNALSSSSENGVQNKVIKAAVDAKQDTLTAGTNITISANNTISSITTWGSVTGSISNQTDLKNALDAKQNTIVFNTEYSASVNKAATMADINDVVGDINAVLDRINGEVI